MLASAEWIFHQSRRGLLPSFSEAGMGRRIGALFSIHRGFESCWETAKPGYLPEFVEWVEEQRSKAA